METALNFIGKVAWWGMFFDAFLVPVVVSVVALIFTWKFILKACASPLIPFLIAFISILVFGNYLHDNSLLYRGYFSPVLAAFIGAVIAVIVFGYFLVKKLLSGEFKFPFFKSASKSTLASGGETLATYAPRRPKHAFIEVQGMTVLKAELLAAVEKHKTAKKNGILLSGNPGNGKTFIAEALAGELKWGFMPITISEIKSKWLGQTTEQLKAVFDTASRSAPLVLFFDECDSMLTSRADMMGGGASNQDILGTVNAFLTGIVDIRSNPNIIVIAASNYPDQLDTAATRDGRFDFKIEIPNPDKEARLGLLSKFSQSKDFKVEFEEGVLDRLVKRWEGFSVVRIRSIAEKILDNAKEQGRNIVGVKEAMAALRAIQGSSGALLPEGTPKLEDLRFDAEQRAKLMSLAKRMENIEEVERMGGQVPKGVLFFGPPGTGKTAVAKALAMTSGWAFLPTSGNDLLAGDGSAIDKLITKARDLRPCIIFIDEAENALGDRTTNRYGSAVTNKILSVTDGVNALQDVMFVAATNHPSQLDAAIVRGGRFSEHYEFKKPEEDTVLIMVREWLAERTGSTPFHEEFSPETVAPFLHGKSPADIKDLLQQAVNTGVGRILSGESTEKKITIRDLHAVMGA
jgi:transitional endoplasmic reticulum ATPase